MSAGARLAAFGVAAILALGGGAAIGAAVGPIDPPDPAPRHAPTGAPHPTVTTSAHDHAGTDR